MSDTYGGKLRTFGRKKAGTSTFSNPSLVSPTTPTLANPTRGFGLPTNNIIQAQTSESTDLQEAQAADESSKLLQALEQRSFGHDISRIALRRPQAKLTVGEPGDKYEQEADWMANQVMRMVVPDKPNADSVQPVEDTLQRKCTGCEEEEVQRSSDSVVSTPIALEPQPTPEIQREPNGMPPTKGTTQITKNTLVQPKLTIGQPDDQYEQEADQVPEEVMSMAPPATSNIQRQAEEEQIQPAADGVPKIQQDPDDATTTTPSGLQRVQAAIAGNDLQALITIQHELRKQMLTDPLHPPEDARAGLATARTWTMDRIAAIRDTYAPLLADARTGGSTGTDGTGPVEVIEILMDDECTRYLNVLMEGDPQYRYQHFNNAVSEKVFAAVRLHSARRGVSQIGHRAEAEAEARSHGHLPSGAWCGAFAYTQAEQGGGLDPHWAGAMQGEGGIRSALAYLGASNPWVWVFDHWEKLKEYHASRGSVRWYQEIDKSPPVQGIQAGDLVLMDNAFGTNPDHITTAISFDGRFLTTVGGNQGSNDPKDETGVSRSKNAIDLQNNPSPNDVTNKDASGKPILDGNGNRTSDPKKTKNVRVHGTGRWSVVDYERHIYMTSPSMPTAPPSSATLATLR